MSNKDFSINENKLKSLFLTTIGFGIGFFLNLAISEMKANKDDVLNTNKEKKNMPNKFIQKHNSINKCPNSTTYHL